MLFVLRLIARNALRQKLRVALTVFGLTVAIASFGMLRTIVAAWYAGSEATSSARMVTRSAVSLTFPLPLNYATRLRGVDGVASVAWGNWFGGVYQTERNFFPQFAVSGESFLAMYPEYVIPPEQLKAFLRDRTGAVVGRKTADTYGFKVGDQVPIRGTIFPGTWTFTIRAIYDGSTERIDSSQFFFHWEYLNETIKKAFPRRADMVGIYFVELREPGRAAEVARAIDAQFRNSLAETLTETEKAFQLGFVAMTEAILIAIEAVSFVVILIIMAVMANTIAMTARERVAEYATLKAIGFSEGFVARLITGESLAVALAGGAIGVALTFPLADLFVAQLGTLFPVFNVSRQTVLMQLAATLAVGAVAAALPAWRSARVRIVDGLRHVG